MKLKDFIKINTTHDDCIKFKKEIPTVTLFIRKGVFRGDIQIHCFGADTDVNRKKQGQNSLIQMI